MRNIISTIVVIATLLAFGFGIWMIKRTFNYSFSYEDKVNQTIEKKYEERIKSLEKRITLLENKK